MKQVVVGTQYSVDVYKGGLDGKCVYATYGWADTDEAESEIVRLKFKFAKDGVDTTDYLYVVRPVDRCDWVYDEEYIQGLRQHALNLWEVDNDPDGVGKECFVDGFIEGVFAQQEEKV
jgi:hypothetical protein